MNPVAQKTIAFLENKMAKTATVLATRAWNNATFIAVDLHLPNCDMSKWQQSQHIKCKVKDLTYRDYSPACWDVETRTCTLFIDAAHEGPGSRWARSLASGHVISYLGVASSHQQPVPNKRMVFLGDESAMGHFFSLQQLADDPGMVSGAIAMSEKGLQDEFARYFPQSGLAALHKTHWADYSALARWIDDQPFAEPANTIFYLAGYVPGVVGLRKILKQKGYTGNQVKVQGFWD